MASRIKIRIANTICVAAFVLSVVLLFVYPQISSAFFGLGMISGFRAANWGKQLQAGEGLATSSSPFLISNSLGTKLTWGWLLFYVPLTALLLLLGSARLSEFYLFKYHSIEVSGFVTAKDKAERGLTPYGLTYHYYAEDGTRYERNQVVSIGTWLSLKVDDMVSVKYLPNRPWNGRLDYGNEEVDEGGGAFFEICLGIVIFLWGTWAFVFYLKKFRQAQT